MRRWTGPEATREAGEALGGLLRAGDMIGLVGDLGAGKTSLVQGIARGLSVPPDVRVTSPTFTLVNEYQGGRLPLYHADLYRIERELELEELGLDELSRRADGVLIVEWSDRFRVLPADHLEVRISIAGDDAREVEILAHGKRSAELAAAWPG